MDPSCAIMHQRATRHDQCVRLLTHLKSPTAARVSFFFGGDAIEPSAAEQAAADQAANLWPRVFGAERDGFAAAADQLDVLGVIGPADALEAHLDATPVDDPVAAALHAEACHLVARDRPTLARAMAALLHAPTPYTPAEVRDLFRAMVAACYELILRRAYAEINRLEDTTPVDLDRYVIQVAGCADALDSARVVEPARNACFDWLRPALERWAAESEPWSRWDAWTEGIFERTALVSASMRQGADPEALRAREVKPRLRSWVGRRLDYLWRERRHGEFKRRLRLVSLHEAQTADTGSSLAPTADEAVHVKRFIERFGRQPVAGAVLTDRRDGISVQDTCTGHGIGKRAYYRALNRMRDWFDRSER